MGNMMSLHLKMALLHKLAALLVISLEWMTWTVQKTVTGTNQILHGISAKKMPVWSCVSMCEQEKASILCLSGSPLLSSMALARGLRGSRKDLRRLRLVCLWWSSHLSVCRAPSLHLWTPVSRGHRRSCTYRDTVHLLIDTGDTSDVGYVIYRRHWLDMIACTK